MRISANERVAKKILDLIDYWELGEDEIGRYLARIAPKNLWNKLMNMMKSTEDSDKTDEKNASGLPNLDNMFKGGFPKLPEKFLKGHMARLAQEMVKDITPEDLGINPEMLKDCEKNPSRAFSILLSLLFL